ncbi:cyanophycin synthetase [Deinococcus maricopensis]|uniref:Cyanophycin synthetase n=1 Tax=Deinococcus maricopensis (strain DSM 21211 / LMG 22137 / NRRL B-23946 / LB-34) TaxID=709986 RepID=E8U3R8_DEIML|nr:cyanophycin synthetase [Deinococcus maricopensis]ADV68761.1 cyanophycin synthetase [Deinococcus maricopensis DSM 21211]
MTAHAQPHLTVVERQVYRGPNIYGYRPMLRFQLDLGALEAHPSNTLPGFTERLVALLPTLHNHGCSYREPGGFIRRLEDGTWIGHITEHVALELQTLAGTRVTYGKTRSVPGQPGVYNIVYRYLEERVGLLAGVTALRLVNSLLPEHLRGLSSLTRLLPDDVTLPYDLDAPFDLERELGELRRIAKRYALGPTTRALVQETERRGIPTIRLDDNSLVQLGYGRYSRRIRASITGNTSYIATETASDKALTKTLLDRAGLPVPRGAVVRTAEEAVRAAKRVGYPVVTKPLDGNHGRGVSMDLMTPEQVEGGFEEARQHSRNVVVEQQYRGNDHRVLVVNGHVVAVAERVPAHVVGDGTRTIRALVDAVNEDPRRGDGHENVMTRIKIDEHVLRLLERAGRTPDTVPAAGETVFLRDTANMSTGGTAVDRTDVIHPYNRTVARRAAQVIGLDVAGIDFITPDISKPVHETGGGIVEVNAAPGFRMHLQPSEGKPRNVAGPVLDMLFPKDTPCRIPVIAITGTNGKSTTSRMVAHILKHAGKVVGLTTSNGIYVDGELIMGGDTTGPKSAKVILSDPNVEVAVLETARGGILREGLGFDRADVGAVLNIQPDHLGMKGIETVEDLAYVKSLVVEVVTDTGTSVLNADDPLTVNMQRKAGGSITFFSMQDSNACSEHLQRHIDEGGTAVVREATLLGDELVLYRAGHRYPVIRAREIPATLGGYARVNIANALAAIGVAVGAGVELPVIRAALGSFSTSFEQSPGRLNLYEGHPFRVLLDYAHNPDGLRPLAELVPFLRPAKGRVIGVFGVAGDRRDVDIREMGAILAGMFDLLILREDTDRRGRAPGEGAELTREGALAAGMNPEQIQVILHEPDAIDAALRAGQAGDLVVILPNDVEDAWAQIHAFDSTPARTAALEAAHD